MSGLFGAIASGMRAVESRARVTDMGPPRDPVIAEWLGALGTTASGVHVTAGNARECDEVDACVTLIEDTVATVPLDLYERGRAEGDRSRASGHPLHELLHDEPNGWQTSAEFRQMMEGWRQTYSRAAARIVTTTRGPVALEPMHPDTFRPFRTNRGELAFRWDPPEGGPTRTLLQHEVLYLRDGPARGLDLVASQSKVDRHRDAIGLAMACSQYLSRFFANGATPKAAIKIPTEVSNKAAEALRERWEQRHRGLENAHRVAILEGGLDIKDLGMSNDDAQVVAVYEMAVAKIARTWGVPLHLIGETSKSTSWGSGIEQQSIGFISYYMRPKFVVWEQALNRTLMSRDMRRRFYFEFNIDGLLRGDFKTRMEGFGVLVQWGLATPNEIRRLMNMAPVDGGDERLHPLNMAPASRIMDVLLRDSAGKQQRDVADQVTKALADFVALAKAA